MAKVVEPYAGVFSTHFRHELIPNPGPDKQDRVDVCCFGVGGGANALLVGFYRRAERQACLRSVLHQFAENGDADAVR